MKQIIGIFILIHIFLSVSGQVDVNQTNAQLAQQYFTDKEFGKAAPLYKSLYNVTKSYYYFRQYISCLAEQSLLDEADDEIKREFKKTKTPSPDLYIDWGHILKLKKQPEEAQGKFDQALKVIPKTESDYILASNSFLQWSEFEMARQVFLLAQKSIPNQKFYFELATVYFYLRNYDAMMEEYMNLIDQDENNLARVESRLSSALYLDIDNGLMELFKKTVLKRIQANPNSTGYNRLMIWLLLQEKKFSAALRQFIALDKRTNNEDASIFGLAQMALNNQEYAEAGKAYQYILAKGIKNPFYKDAFVFDLHSTYLQYTGEGGNNLSEAESLAVKFNNGLDLLGYIPFTYNLAREYGHLLAFYCHQSDKAIGVIEKAMKINPLLPDQIGDLKTELADIYLYSGDPYEAILLYSQAIDANKNNTVGDIAKFKKAKLAYYTGNFSWAKAQLDVLKASTSKLTANDAMELSLLIGNNLDLDTTSVPLQLFARADFLFFRNQDSLALATLDTLENQFPSHSLVDDILFRRAAINDKNGDYQKAVENLEQIKNSFSWESLADDAIFMLAQIYQFDLKNPEKAMENYKEIMFRYPGSFFVSEARKYFRDLSGDTKTPPGEKTPGSGQLQ
jgi:tetratricopeptide (TPR) repeat protein